LQRAHCRKGTLAQTPCATCRITKEFAGTPEDPVVVTSAFTERVVGVPDPEDDCLVVWSLIKANEPPKQIIPGGEYFVRALRPGTPRATRSILQLLDGAEWSAHWPQ
jgi:hypothetical protein